MKEQTLRLPGNSVLKRGLLLGILLLAHAPSTAHGQQLVAGDTIRVKPSRSTEPKRQWTVEQPVPRWTEATVVRLTPDTLWYQSSGSVSPISMDIADIQRPTHRDHRVAGAVIGGVTGGAIGAWIGHGNYSLRSSCGIFCSKPNPLSRGEHTAFMVAVGASVGGFLGYHAGKLLGHWETVELDQLSVGGGNPRREHEHPAVTGTPLARRPPPSFGGGRLLV